MIYISKKEKQFISLSEAVDYVKTIGKCSLDSAKSQLIDAICDRNIGIIYADGEKNKHNLPSGLLTAVSYSSPNMLPDLMDFENQKDTIDWNNSTIIDKENGKRPVKLLRSNVTTIWSNQTPQKQVNEKENNIVVKDAKSLVFADCPEKKEAFDAFVQHINRIANKDDKINRQYVGDWLSKNEYHTSWAQDFMKYIPSDRKNQRGAPKGKRISNKKN